MRKWKPEIEGSRPEWCISSMIYSRDTPVWLDTLEMEMPMGRMKTWLQWKDANWSGTGMSYHLDWPRLSYREQVKEGDEEADRGNDRKTSKSGLALNGIWYYGKTRTVSKWRKPVVKSTVVPNSPDYRIEEMMGENIPVPWLIDLAN